MVCFEKTVELISTKQISGRPVDETARKNSADGPLTPADVSQFRISVTTPDPTVWPRELAKHKVAHELLTVPNAEHGLRDGDAKLP